MIERKLAKGKILSKYRLDLTQYKTSSAGTTVDDPQDRLKVELDYSGFDWFMLTFFGTTRIPKKARFICLKTGENFETLTDRKRLEHYIMYRRT